MYRDFISTQIQAYIEYLMVIDSSVITNQQTYLQTTNTDIVYANMRIYFAHVVNGVSNLQMANYFYY